MHLTRFHWDDNTFDHAQQGLKQKFPEAFLDPKIQPLLEFDWHTYLCDKKRVSHQIILVWNPPIIYLQTCFSFLSRELWGMLRLCTVFYILHQCWKKIHHRKGSETVSLEVKPIQSFSFLKALQTHVFTIIGADQTIAQNTLFLYYMELYFVISFQLNSTYYWSRTLMSIRQIPTQSWAVA